MRNSGELPVLRLCSDGGSRASYSERLDQLAAEGAGSVDGGAVLLYAVGQIPVRGDHGEACRVGVGVDELDDAMIGGVRAAGGELNAYVGRLDRLPRPAAVEDD